MRSKRFSRSSTGNFTRRSLFIAGCAAFFLNGCYYLKQARVQLDIITNSRDLLDVYGDPGLSETHAKRLDLIREAKRFSEETLGLKPSGNYTTYYDLGRRAVTYVVSAVRKDRFEPYFWSFPIVGRLPYKGYFDKKDAEEEAARLEGEGTWDVLLGESAAYSTLGWFRDPVFSSMLNSSDAGVTCTIIHELVHGTIYVGDHTDFNESLAQFVGIEGTLQLFERRYGRNTAMVRSARARFSDEERFDAFLRGVFERLCVLYTSEMSSEQKIEERKVIFAGAKEEFRRLALRFRTWARYGDIELDNAWIVAQIRYGRYNSFRRVYERVQGSWPAFFATVSAMAASGNPLEAVEALAKDD